MSNMFVKKIGESIVSIAPEALVIGLSDPEGKVLFHLRLEPEEAEMLAADLTEGARWMREHG